jgi:uncharacterized membrane protein YhhN
MAKDGVLRAVFAGALVAGVSYYFADRLGVTEPLAVVWKGAGVALLAVWCAMQARSRDGWMITAIMAFGALGDVLLETAGLTTGAVAFVAGHGVAIALYGRNRRRHLTLSQRLLALLVVPLSIMIAASLVASNDALPIAAYTAFVATMAACAWASRFPRYRTGIGAMMFLVSDLLIFARMGTLATSPVPGMLIWPLYFGGQVLIALGVTHALMQNRR